MNNTLALKLADCVCNAYSGTIPKGMECRYSLFTPYGLKSTPGIQNDSSHKLIMEYKNDSPHPIASLYQDDNIIVLAFRGTDNFKNWITDLDAPLRYVGSNKFHEGFLGLFQHLDEQFNTIRKLITSDRLFYITGHSLGAALASIFTTLLGSAEWYTQSSGVTECLTFASPKIGNCSSVKPINNVINTFDIVTHVPVFYSRPGKDQEFEDACMMNPFHAHSMLTYQDAIRNLTFLQ